MAEEEVVEEQAPLSDVMSNVIARRRAYNAMKRRQITSNLLARAGGGAPMAIGDVPTDTTNQYTALTKQYEALVKAEAGVGGDPAKMVTAKLTYLGKVLGEAMKSLNKNKDIYSQAQYNRAKLELDTRKAEFQAAANLLDKTSSGSGRAGKTFDASKVKKAITSLGVSATSESRPKALADARAIGMSLTGPGEREAFLNSIKILMQGGTDSTSQALKGQTRNNLVALFGEAGEAISGADPVDSLAEDLSKIDRSVIDMQAGINAGLSAEDAAQQVGVPIDLTPTVTEMYFTEGVDEEGNPEFQLREGAQRAIEESAMIEGVNEKMNNFVARLEGSVTGSSGGAFATEFRKVIQAHGADSIPGLFEAIGIESPEGLAAQEAQREGYRGRAEDVTEKLTRLSQPQGYAGTVHRAVQAPAFQKAMDQYGFKDPSQAFRAFRKQAGKVAGVDRAKADLAMASVRRGADPAVSDALAPGLQSRQDRLRAREARVKQRVIAELGGRTNGGNIDELD